MKNREIDLVHARHFEPSTSEIYEHFDLVIGDDEITRLTREELDLLQSAIEHAKVGLDKLKYSFDK